jgi:hypothetical protein
MTEEETKKELEALKTSFNLQRMKNRFIQFNYKIKVLEAKLEGYREERERILKLLKKFEGQIGDLFALEQEINKS